MEIRDADNDFNDLAKNIRPDMDIGELRNALGIGGGNRTSFIPNTIQEMVDAYTDDIAERSIYNTGHKLTISEQAILSIPFTSTLRKKQTISNKEMMYTRQSIEERMKKTGAESFQEIFL